MVSQVTMSSETQMQDFPIFKSLEDYFLDFLNPHLGSGSTSYFSFTPNYSTVRLWIYSLVTYINIAVERDFFRASMGRKEIKRTNYQSSFEKKSAYKKYTPPWMFSPFIAHINPITVQRICLF